MKINDKFKESGSNSHRFKTNHKPKIHLTTLGCAKNLYDSEILLGQFRANDIPLTDDPQQADVLIINTCGFITPAKQESIEAILEAGKIKTARPGRKLLVCGCLSKRYQKDLRREIPEVDEYFGTEDFLEILDYLQLQPASPHHLYEHRYLSRHSHYAYLKISEGCNHKCAFCAIPLMRGRHRSRRMEDILSEARILAQQGVKELILIAQDTTFYGLDLYKKQRLVDLIRELEEIPGIEWIRIHYAYPTTFQDELVDLMRNSRKVVKYLDLPIQHISDRVLKMMKRGGTSRRIQKILHRMRERIPEVALRTTLIVGHPRETEEDFKILTDFIQETQFDRLGVFVYSPEENTAAHALPHPPEKIAQRRYQTIMEIQQNISWEKNRQKIGRTFKVLIDEYQQQTHTAIGRTYADSPEIDNEVIIEDVNRTVVPGEFYNVKIYNANEYELFGKIERF
ncbi:MAG: 30S ribosomal protein S12 methylthiotransferase RimO [Calditrichia bacterium]